MSISGYKIKWMFFFALMMPSVTISAQDSQEFSLNPGAEREHAWQGPLENLEVQQISGPTGAIALFYWDGKQWIGVELARDGRSASLASESIDVRLFVRNLSQEIINYTLHPPESSPVGADSAVFSLPPGARRTHFWDGPQKNLTIQTTSGPASALHAFYWNGRDNSELEQSRDGLNIAFATEDNDIRIELQNWSSETVSYTLVPAPRQTQN